MHADRNRDGWAQASTRALDTWRFAMQERTNLARAASTLVMPSEERHLAPDDFVSPRDENTLGTWLAELVRYTLCCETVGIVLGPKHSMPLRLIATAGVAADTYTAWWNDVCTEAADPRADEESIYRPTARHVYAESGEKSDATPLVVRLTLPLLSGDRRFGLLIVEFKFGERIVPDTLPTARALAHLVAVALDHDHMTRTRARLAATVAQLRRENTNLETAIIQTAHELRGPLTAMRLGSQLAERHLRLANESNVLSGPPDAHMVRAVSAARLANQSVGKAERLLTDLTDVARIRTGSLEMRLTRCDLANVVSEAVAGQRVAWPTRILHLDVPFEAVPVIADADRVSQVIGNYLTNALKYSPSNQPIEVLMEAGDGEVRVAVRDHGVGLTREDQKRIWERFYRTDQLHHFAKPDGLGIGLFICRQLVEQMGGRVGVESVPGAGSTFWFAVPGIAG